MRRKRTIVFVILAALLIFGMTACSDQNLTGKKTVTITNGSTNETRTCEVGETITLEANVPDGEAFEYWEVNGENYSTDKTLVYKVTTDVTIKSVFSQAIRTVQIITEDKNYARSYAVGTEIKLSATPVSNQSFVCWLVNDKPVSFDSDATYTVAEDAVVRAVYAPDKQISLVYDGGTTENEEITVSTYDRNASYDGALLVGYDYTLPVPTKERHKFVCWTKDGKALTDENGKSLAPYDGDATEFVAKYEEDPYVTIEIINASDNTKQSSRKVYIDDGSAEIKADELDDRQCYKWDILYEKDNKEVQEEISTETSFYFDLTQDFIASGKTYKFYANYREAYRVIIISGDGSGSYAREDDIALVGSKPSGKNFVDWTISYSASEKEEKETVALARRTRDGALCVIYENEEGTPCLAAYYSETEEKVIKATLGANWENEYKKISREGGSIKLSELEKLGVTISRTETRIDARYKNKEFTFIYSLDCKGLDDSSKKSIEASGYALNSETGRYEKTCYYDYNDEIETETPPSLEHFNFENWQNAASGEKIPTTMPSRNVSVFGTFAPKQYSITISSAAGSGSAKIGNIGNVTSGKYGYGSTIKFYVTAYAGYTYDRWVRVGDETDLPEETIANVSETKGTDIVYVFEYEVKKDENFVCTFKAREYTITYVFSIMYDGEDVTKNEAYFKESKYNDYSEETAEAAYGSDVTLRDKYAIGDGNVDLIYSAEHWTISDWVADGEGLDVSKTFKMPKRDVTVRSVCTIKTHTVTIGNATGVTTTLKAINGKAPDDYKDVAGYKVPYGAEFKVEISIDKGKEFDKIQASGGTLDESEYSHESIGGNKYLEEVTFNLEVSEATVTYTISSKAITYTVTYYVYVDYEHNDEANSLSQYVVKDDTQTKDYDGKKYYKLDKFLAVSGKNLQNATKEGITYNQSVTDAAIDASKARYSFGGWTRICNGEVYKEQTMPDSDMEVYGTLSLNKYTLTLAKDMYRFDNAETTAINTADVSKIVENNEETDYDTGAYSATEHLYFSEYTIKRHSPTGYDFTRWRITVGTDDACTIEIKDQKENSTYTATTNKGNTVKYKVNSDKDTISLFLTEDCTVKAEFAVQKFTASTEDGSLGIRVSGTQNEYQDTIEFEYRSRLDVRYSYYGALQGGQKITSFDFSLDNGVTNTETIETPFDEETLSYKYTAGTGVTVATTVDAYTQNVTIKVSTEAIKYKIYYTVYGAANSLDGISNNGVTTCRDGDGNDYTVTLNEEISLIGESEVKEIAKKNGLECDGSMYSGWYVKDAGNKLLSKDDVEGQGNYSTYTHRGKQGEMPTHAHLSCYLIRFVETDDTNKKWKMNATIKSTPQYNNYFSKTYKEITLPEKNSTGEVITAIADDAFKDMFGLEKVTFSSYITTVGANAFSGCSALIETGLTAQITTIGANAFSGCTSIADVTLGANVSTVGANAFSGMTSLQNVYYNSEVKENHSSGTGIFAGSGNSGEFTLTIGANTTVIPNGLFGGNGKTYAAENLRTVIFAASNQKVTINKQGFAYSGLKTLTANGRLGELSGYVFEMCENFIEFDFVNSGLTEIPQEAFAKSCLETVTLTDVTTIGDKAFWACEKLESVYYDAVTAIGAEAFSSRAEDGTEDKDNSLKRFTSVDRTECEIRLDNLATLGDRAFYGAANVESIYIGGSDPAIGTNVFAKASKVTKITYNAKNGKDRDAGVVPFGDMTATLGLERTLEIGEDVKTIPARMFASLNYVKEITIPSTVKGIGAFAFQNMSNLGTIYFNVDGDNYVLNGGNPFNGAGSGGIKVVFGAAITKIRDNAFDTSAITSFEITENGTLPLEIGKNAFSSVATVNIPARQSLVLGANAFNGLTTITIDENIPTITFKENALGSKVTKVTLFGKNYSSKWFSVQADGTLVAERTGSGLKATISGKVATNASVTVERDEELVVESGATFSISNTTTVKGKFADNGGTIDIGSNTFKAIAYSVDDFIAKDEYANYTDLAIAASVTFSGEKLELTNARTSFSIEDGAAVTFGGGADVRKASTFKVETNSEAILTENGNFEATSLNGNLTVSKDTTVTINGKTLINNDETPDANTRGLRITDGTTLINSNGNTYGYTISNGTAEINTGKISGSEEFVKVGEWELKPESTTSWKIKVSEGAKLFVTKPANLESYEAEEGSFLSVGANATLTLKEYNETIATTPQWTVTAQISSWVETTRDKKYYGSFDDGIEKAGKETENLTLYLETDISSDFNRTIPGNCNSFDFNGHKIEVESGTITYKGNLTVKNAIFTATGNEAAVIQQADGSTAALTIEGGTITAQGTHGVIDTKGSLIVTNEATITAESGKAIICTAITIDEGTAITGGEYGIYISTTDTAKKTSVVNGTVKSTHESGTALYAYGAGHEITLGEKGQLIGNTALHVYSTGADDEVWTFTGEAGSVIGGTAVGARLEGNGRYLLNGEASASGERQTKQGEGTIYKGALVIVDKEGLTSNASVTVGNDATITNENGDAILYVGYGTDLTNKSDARTTLTMSRDKVTVNGTIAALITAFGSESTEDKERYSLGADNTIRLTASGEYVYKGDDEKISRVIEGAIVSLEKAQAEEVFTDASVYYVTERAGLAAAFEASDYVRILKSTGVELISNIAENKTLIAANGISLTGDTVEVNGTFGMVGSSEANIGSITVNGTLGIIGATLSVTNITINGGQVIGNGSGSKEITLKGTLSTNNGGAISLTSGMTVESGATADFGRSLTLAQDGVIDNKGTVTIGNKTYDPTETDPSYSNVGGTISTDDGGTLTLYENATIYGITLKKNAALELIKNSYTTTTMGETEATTTTDNPNEHEITVTALEIAEDNEFGGLFTITDLILGGNATFNNAVTVKGSVTLKDEAKRNSLILEGEGNDLYGKEIRYDAVINNDTTFIAGNSTYIDVYGKITFNGGTVDFKKSASASSADAQLNVTSDGTNFGRLLFASEGTSGVNVGTIYLQANGGIEYYSGTLTVHGAIIADGILANSGFHIDRGWIFVESKDKIGTNGFIKYSGWCSELYESQVSGYNGTVVNVKYDDCNPFSGVTATEKHTSETVSTDVTNGFNSFSELFATFMSDTTDANYTAFYTQAANLYKNSLVDFARNASSTSSGSAIIGINHDYYNGSVSLTTADAKNAIARLFGYGSTDSFVAAANNLVTAYASYDENSALANGCFATENGYVFPIAVKNGGTKPILAYVIIDSENKVSVWVNDVAETLKATNFNSSYYTGSTINNELYCKNILFVTGPALGYIQMTQISTVKYETEVYGATTGIVIGNCEDEEYETKTATCGTAGGDICKYEFSGALEDGTKFELRHDRENVTPPTGKHTFIVGIEYKYEDGKVVAADDGTHKCRECGYTETHTYNNNVLNQIGYICTVKENGEIEMHGYAIGKSCDYCAAPEKGNVTIEGVDINTTGKEFNAKQYVDLSSYATFNRETDEPMIKYAKKGLFYFHSDVRGQVGETYKYDEGHKYYAIYMRKDTTSDIGVYILIEHTDDNHYYVYDSESGKHVCIGCGSEKTDEHGANATREILVGNANGTDYYAIEKYCSHCGEAFGIVEASEQTGATNVADISVDGYTLGATSGTVGENYLFMFVYGGKEYFALAASSSDATSNNIIIGVPHEHTVGYGYDATENALVCQGENCNAKYTPGHACSERGTVYATSYGADGMPRYILGYVDEDNKMLTHACASGCNTLETEFIIDKTDRKGSDLDEALSGYAFIIDGRAYIARSMNADATLEFLKAETVCTSDGDATAYDKIYVMLVCVEDGSCISSYMVKVNHVCTSYLPYAYRESEGSEYTYTHKCAGCGQIKDIGKHEADESKSYMIADYTIYTVVDGNEQRVTYSVLGRPCKHCGEVVIERIDLGEEKVTENSTDLVEAMRGKLDDLETTISRLVKYDGTINENISVVTPRLAADSGIGWTDVAMFAAYSKVVSIDESGTIYEMQEGASYDADTLYNVFYLSYETENGRIIEMPAIFVKHVCNGDYIIYPGDSGIYTEKILDNDDKEIDIFVGKCVCGDIYPKIVSVTGSAPTNGDVLNEFKKTYCGGSTNKTRITIDGVQYTQASTVDAESASVDKTRTVTVNETAGETAYNVCQIKVSDGKDKEKTFYVLVKIPSDTDSST